MTSRPPDSLDAIDLQRLRLVADTVPALLAYLDEGVRYVWTNGAYRRWFGRSPESMRGQHAREVVGEAAWTAVQHHVARALAGEEVSYEARIDFGPGHSRDVKVAYVPDRDASGRVRGFVSMVTDISDMQNAERALRESERMLAESQAAAHVGSFEFILDEDGSRRSLRWSDEAYRIFGRAPGDAVDYDLFISSIHPDDRALVQRAGSAVLGPDGRHETEYRIVRPDGAVRTIHTWKTIERDAASGAARLRGTCQDITERKLAEAERTRALAELKETDRRKDEFLAMLAHELRNPMAPILTSVEILRLAPEDAEASATARAVIVRQVGHMKRLLDDLLDVSRVSQGKIALRRTVLDLGAVLQQAVEMSQSLMAEKGQRLSVASPSAAILVDADPARLVQVFGNLLNNAAKFSEPGGAVEVETAVEDREVVVRVRDRGVGMTPDLLERAFDLFAQDSRSLDRAQGGIGIGLTMVRRLVELHGGSVRAFSEGLGLGSEIVVRLPRASESQEGLRAARDQPRPAIARTSRPLRVLVVDDNVDAATTLADLLTLLGHEVAVAHDGPDALATAKRARPELVFIDIGLPLMDGYELAAALRAAGLDRAALVAVTGYGRIEDMQRSRDRGFDHHIVKPVSLAELQRVIALRGGVSG